MALIVAVLKPSKPRLDLSDPEAQLAADPETSGPAARAAQVVDGLRRHVQVLAQLGQGVEWTGSMPDMWVVVSVWLS